MEETECPCSVIGWETSGLYDTMPIASTITHPDRSVKGFPVQNTPIVQKGVFLINRSPGLPGESHRYRPRRYSTKLSSKSLLKLLMIEV